MRILVINGSPRRQGNTGKLVQWITKALHKEQVEVSIMDLSATTLPLFDGTDLTKESEPVQQLKFLVEQADGFFICTPEYHSAMSGALKNALDFLNRTYFERKPVAIACAGGGGKGGINALNNLRLVMRGLGGLVLSPQCVIDPHDFHEQGEIKEEALPRLQMVTDELIYFTRLLYQGSFEAIPAQS